MPVTPRPVCILCVLTGNQRTVVTVSAFFVMSCIGNVQELLLMLSGLKWQRNQVIIGYACVLQFVVRRYAGV